jgi:hypothetical protein
MLQLNNRKILVTGASGLVALLAAVVMSDQAGRTALTTVYRGAGSCLLAEAIIAVIRDLRYSVARAMRSA